MQRDASRLCVVCDTPSDQYCGSCGVTPYCSQLCQRKDWVARHSSVCHNLKRLSQAQKTVKAANNSEEMTHEASPLRRPHNFKDNQSNRVGRDYSDNKKYSSPGDRGRQQNRQQNRPQQNGGVDEEDGGNKTSSPAHKTQAHKAETPRIKPKQPVASKVDVPSPASQNQMPNKQPSSPVTQKQMALNAAPKSEPAKETKPALVPAEFLVQSLQAGDTVLLSVENVAKECGQKESDGYVCLSLHERYEDQFNDVCSMVCEVGMGYSPQPGETFACQSDGSWYRARCLSGASAAFLDAASLSPLPLPCCPLPQRYTNVPEFSCLLQGNVQVGSQLKCTILSKNGDKVKVSIILCTDGQEKSVGEGTITRWEPEIQWPSDDVKPVAKLQSDQPKAQSEVSATQTQGAAPIAPQKVEVPRPPIRNGSYVLLDAKSLKRACVRPDDAKTTAEFDSVLHDGVLFGMKAKQLTEPPRCGQMVLALYDDGGHYRALVKRTKVKDNRYQIEYVEYGNIEVVPLEKLFPCPPELDLSMKPTCSSIVQLSTIEADTLTSPALEYIETLKDNAVELVATIPNGEKEVPSESLVQFSVAKNKESVNKKLEEMCTPEWKKMEKKGGDVLEAQCIMYSNVKYVSLPTDRPFTLDVIDFSALELGTISGFEKGTPLAEVVLGSLTDKMTEYANSSLCKEPYLPKFEELCICKFPPYPQWFRAVLLEQVEGAGGTNAQVLYIDYGNTGTVAVSDIRKMLPEFIDNYPALACHIEIKDFPSDPTTEQLKAALEYLNVTDAGRGEMVISVCRRQRDVPNMYTVHVPELIAAMLK